MPTPSDIETLAALVQRMVEESGDPMGFDAQIWLRHWMRRPNAALEHRLPLDVLSEPSGLEQVRSTLMCAQSGAYL